MTALRATVPCAANATHTAAEVVAIEADGRTTHLMLCRPCRIEMELARMRGVAIRVTRELRPVLVKVEPPPEPPPRPKRPNTRIPNEYGLTRSAWTLLCRWQDTPRTVHTRETAAELLGRDVTLISRAFRELIALGFVCKRIGIREDFPQQYILTSEGERA